MGADLAPAAYTLVPLRSTRPDHAVKTEAYSKDARRIGRYGGATGRSDRCVTAHGPGQDADDVGDGESDADDEVLERTRVNVPPSPSRSTSLPPSPSKSVSFRDIRAGLVTQPASPWSQPSPKQLRDSQAAQVRQRSYEQQRSSSKLKAKLQDSAPTVAPSSSLQLSSSTRIKVFNETLDDSFFDSTSSRAARLGEGGAGRSSALGLTLDPEASLRFQDTISRQAKLLKTEALESSGFYEVGDALGELAVLRVENRVLRMQLKNRAGSTTASGKKNDPHDPNWELLAEAMTIKTAARKRALKHLFGRDILEENEELRSINAQQEKQLEAMEEKLREFMVIRKSQDRSMKREGRMHTTRVKELEDEMKNMSSRTCVIS